MAKLLKPRLRFSMAILSAGGILMTAGCSGPLITIGSGPPPPWLSSARSRVLLPILSHELDAAQEAQGTLFLFSGDPSPLDHDDFPPVAIQIGDLLHTEPLPTLPHSTTLHFQTIDEEWAQADVEVRALANDHYALKVDVRMGMKRFQQEAIAGPPWLGKRNRVSIKLPLRTENSAEVLMFLLVQPL